MGLKIDVRLQRLSDCPVFLSTVKHGDCPSECGQIRENVGLLNGWISGVPFTGITITCHECLLAVVGACLLAVVGACLLAVVGACLLAAVGHVCWLQLVHVCWLQLVMSVAMQVLSHLLCVLSDVNKFCCCCSF